MMSKPYFCRDDVNFIVVDSAAFVDTLYTWSALNTEDIGRNIAEGLVKITKHVSPKDIHLIGHSLGAHIAGFAGRFFNEKTNKLVSRITGLDPALPCFKEGEELSGLLRGDAEFIDVIHSNPGILGQRNPLGDLDFYPAGLTSIAPGTYSFIVSHSRAVEYFGESVFPGREYDFLGVRCSSLQRVRDGYCKTTEVPMGYSTPHDVKGNYFLDVNGEFPYGKASKVKQSVEDIKCGECKHTKSESGSSTTSAPHKGIDLNILKSIG